jgi:hypothetical protein
MSKTYFDRYSKFRNNNSIGYIPYVKIPVNDTDIYDVFDSNSDRLDNWSSKYYNDNPDYFFLILLANPEYSSLSYSIPNKTILRIPFPLNSALERYNNSAKKYIQYNSID